MLILQNGLCDLPVHNQGNYYQEAPDRHPRMQKKQVNRTKTTQPTTKRKSFNMQGNNSNTHSLITSQSSGPSTVTVLPLRGDPQEELLLLKLTV